MWSKASIESKRVNPSGPQSECIDKDPKPVEIEYPIVINDSGILSKYHCLLMQNFSTIKLRKEVLGLSQHYAVIEDHTHNIHTSMLTHFHGTSDTYIFEQ